MTLWDALRSEPTARRGTLATNPRLHKLFESDTLVEKVKEKKSYLQLQHDTDNQHHSRKDEAVLTRSLSYLSDDGYKNEDEIGFIKEMQRREMIRNGGGECAEGAGEQEVQAQLYILSPTSNSPLCPEPELRTHKGNETINHESAEEGLPKQIYPSLIEQIEVVDMQVSTDLLDENESRYGDAQQGVQEEIVVVAQEARRKTISRRSSLAPSFARLSAKFVESGIQTRGLPEYKTFGVQVDTIELRNHVSKVSIGLQVGGGPDDFVEQQYADLDAVLTKNTSAFQRTSPAHSENIHIEDDDARYEEIQRSLRFDDEEETGRVAYSKAAAGSKPPVSASKPQPRPQTKKKDKPYNAMKERLYYAATKKPREEAKTFVHIPLSELQSSTSPTTESNSGEANGVRRSKRQRFPVLKYWKNERVVYNRRDSQIMPCIAEIIELENDSSPEVYRNRGAVHCNKREHDVDDDDDNEHVEKEPTKRWKPSHPAKSNGFEESPLDESAFNLSSVQAKKDRNFTRDVKVETKRNIKKPHALSSSSFDEDDEIPGEDDYMKQFD